MNQKSFLIVILAIFLLGVSLGVLRFRESLVNFIIQLIPRPEFTPKPAELVLSEQELADMVKPSVVRIAQHVTGKVEIAPFDFDFKTRSVFSAPGERVSIPIDEYLAGSGFVAHPNGYILTNAHVVSRETMKIFLVGQVVISAIFEKASKLSQEELQRLQTEEAAMQEFSDKIFEYVLRESKSDLQNKVAVLNPSSKATQLRDLFSEGFEAEVMDVNDNFFRDNRDIGLIRISAVKLPAMRLGSSDALTTGKRIYVFGFPATAEFNRKNPLEATFTQGVISALKDSEQRDFKIYQTDAKVSQGSSGGPLFDERGDAIGIVTFGTSKEIQAAGDVFAFALPIKLANEVLLNRLVFNTVGNYAEHFQKGLAWARGRRCKKALDEFELARNTHDYFGIDRYLKPHEEKCRVLMSQRMSIDTSEEELRERLKGFGPFVWWAISIGTIVVGGFVAAIFLMWKRMKKEEEEMHKLQSMVAEQQKLQAQQAEQSGKQFVSGAEIKNDIRR